MALEILINNCRKSTNMIVYFDSLLKILTESMHDMYVKNIFINLRENYE